MKSAASDHLLYQRNFTSSQLARATENPPRAITPLHVDFELIGARIEKLEGLLVLDLVDPDIDVEEFGEFLAALLVFGVFLGTHESIHGCPELYW